MAQASETAARGFSMPATSHERFRVQCATGYRSHSAGAAQVYVLCADGAVRVIRHLVDAAICFGSGYLARPSGHHERRRVNNARPSRPVTNPKAHSVQHSKELWAVRPTVLWSPESAFVFVRREKSRAPQPAGAHRTMTERQFNAVLKTNISYSIAAGSRERSQASRGTLADDHDRCSPTCAC